MKANKILSVLITLMILAFTLSLPCMAGTSPSVYVTISNGDIVIAREQVTVTDTDGDRVLSISDAIYLAHEAKFEGGAAAGFSVENTAFGLSLTKLLGVSNGGAYGYFLNDASPSSLADAIKDGDNIYAYLYTDTVSYSDTYSFFDIQSADVTAGGSITLTLFSAGFDENWAPIKAPVSNAVITVNGKATEIKTDENGKATVTLDESGKHVISAKSASVNLVPPICEANVSEVSPDSGDNAMLICIIAAIAVVLILLVVFGRRKHDD